MENSEYLSSMVHLEDSDKSEIMKYLVYFSKVSQTCQYYNLVECSSWIVELGIGGKISKYRIVSNLYSRVWF